MIDYLLKFSSKKTAYTFALNHGFAYSEQYTNSAVLIHNGADYSLYEIGPHRIIDESFEEAVSDGKYWFALRLLRETGLPSNCDKYVVWSSLQGLPRPKNNPEIPNINWA
jgi:hypothetical protein